MYRVAVTIMKCIYFMDYALCILALPLVSALCLLCFVCCIDESISTELFGAAQGVKISGINAAAAGALSGLVAQLTTTPLDVARTRIMIRSKNTNTTAVDSSAVGIANGCTDSSTNIVSVLLAILRQEGAGALWRGVLPRALRAIASGGIQFASYELTQNAMK